LSLSTWRNILDLLLCATKQNITRK